MPKSGIYIIISKVHPDRIYIGSSCNLKARFARHKRDFYLQSHANMKLQNHANKYGVDDLVFEVICHCDHASLLHIEQALLNEFEPYFNICPTAYSRLGSHCTLETRKLMRQAAHDKRANSWYFRPH